MAFGPEAGLEIVDGLVADGNLERYHHLSAVRGDLLFRLGRKDEARVEFERAASLTMNTRERDVLAARAAACAREPGLPSRTESPCGARRPDEG
jgi:predicted RNA polymerase sigma factor